MRKAWTLAVTALLITVAALLAAPEGPEPAKDVLSRARAKAAQGNRNVLLVYHASWCGWCRKLEAFLTAPEIRPVIDRHFEVAYLTVQERGAKQKLDNPGAADLMAKLSGGRSVAGLPFYAVLDPKGEPLGTSLVAASGGEPGNLGFPGTPEEIQAFVALVKRTAPSATGAELETLRKGLEERMPKKG